jgi:hypothetical protein
MRTVPKLLGLTLIFSAIILACPTISAARDYRCLKQCADQEIADCESHGIDSAVCNTSAATCAYRCDHPQ